jgi:hypothetical protein
VRRAALSGSPTVLRLYARAARPTPRSEGDHALHRQGLGRRRRFSRRSAELSSASAGQQRVGLAWRAMEDPGSTCGLDASELSSGLPAQERLSSLLDISWTFRCPACQRASPDESPAGFAGCRGDLSRQSPRDLSRPDLASGFEVIMAEARARPSEADPPRRSAGAPRPARFGECSGGSAGPPRSCRERPRGRRWVDDQPMSVHGLLVTRLRSRQL